MLLLAAAWVGSAACQPCHPKIFADYLATPMARSSGRADSVAPAQFSAAGQNYRIANNRLLFGSGEAPFSYFIGSNTGGCSYLTAREAYLFELPVTWYRKTQRWDAPWLRDRNTRPPQSPH